MLIGTDRVLLNQTADLVHASGAKALVITDVKRAEAEVSRFKPHMIVVSLDDTDAVGWKLMFRHGIHGNASVIAITEYADAAQELTVLRLGAQDYIRLPVTPEVLFERIKFRGAHSAEDGEDLSEEVIEIKGRRGDLVIDKGRFQAFWMESLLSLTKTEFTLLSALARHDGMVKSRDQLIDAIYSHSMCSDVNDRTVDSHVKRVRNKIRMIDPAFDGIETVYGLGYKLNIERARKAKTGALSCQKDSSVRYSRRATVPGIVSQKPLIMHTKTW
ncbi:response regulator transcription factor [uncultured Roseovarius sp.]|uniref:winged helix-turn-helix domain-containing protein n=1 Tax=uncultured Roseovarius sp. TaxID=293344 RepID=UPI00262F331A|nr:response regulator transcription factor [uncultured Roseovarius sp.]